MQGARLDLRVSCKNRVVSDYRFLGSSAYLEASTIIGEGVSFDTEDRDGINAHK